MTRARLLKPGFFLNEDLAELPPLARILFAGLWCIADRAGRLEDRPKRIKHETLPYDEADVDALLTQLHDAGFILRYGVAGARYIQIVNFAKHQSPHIHEAQSVIPASGQPSGDSDASTVQAPYKHDTSTAYPNPIAVPIAVPDSESVNTDDSEGSGHSSIVVDALASGASSDDDSAPHAPDADVSLSEPEPTSEKPATTPAKIAPDAPAMRLAIQLREAVLAHNSTALDARKAMTGQGIQAWARKLDALISDPRRAPPDVDAVIAYATSDTRFWQAIVLNPDKLKKHFDTINGQRLNARNGQNGGNGNGRHAETARSAGGRYGSGSGNGRAGTSGASHPPVGTPEYVEWARARDAQLGIGVSGAASGPRTRATG